MKNCKTVLAFLAFIVISSNYGCQMSKDECKAEYSLITAEECPTTPTPASICPAGTTIRTISETDALNFINFFKTSPHASVQYGVLTDPCQVLLVAQATGQNNLSFYMAKKTNDPAANDYLVLAKYATAAGNVMWADVTDMSDPNGPLCPPGGKCS